jgi:hypothetical protein
MRIDYTLRILRSKQEVVFLLKILTFTYADRPSMCFPASSDKRNFVIECSDGKLLRIEVKATTKITASDFKHLKVLAGETGKKFLRGIIFYTGKEAIPFAKNLFALPVDMLW